MALCAATHAAAALSLSMCFPEMRFATKFWSADVQLNFLMTFSAGEPLFENLFETSLSRPYDGYSHACFPLSFSSSSSP